LIGLHPSGEVKMPQDYFNLNCRAALMAAIASAYPIIGYTAPAAQVDFAVGNVTAVGANGQSRALGKGAQIEQGDTVNTNGGRAQLRFTDGAYVSLQPESQFRIDQYRYDGKQDGNEKGFFSLLKGGLRTITGLVGRTNKSNYQVTTSVATIGIRGTEYTIEYGHSITGGVGEGQIEVCNSGGCLSVTNGESYYVQGPEFKPVLTNKRSDLPPPPPDAPPQAFKQNETVDNNGDLCALFPAQCGLVPPSPVAPVGMIGTQTLNTVEGNFCDGACYGPNSDVIVVFDSTGQVVSFNSIVPANVAMGGNDGIVAWGTFTEVSNFGALHHFVAGMPVPSADLTNLGGTTGSYSLIGSTPVTNGSDSVIGKLNSASLTVNFGPSASYSADMKWTINGSPVNAILSGFGSGSTLSSFNNSCGNSCSVSASVALFGPNASRAGMVYNIRDSSFDALGAAAFTKK
jgi:hypothetical protein